MPPPHLLTSLSSNRIAQLIGKATFRVVYAAPGIQEAPAMALVALSQQDEPPYLTISLDFDERTLRMGYGSLEAVDLLRKAEVGFTHSPGFRTGILIVDNHGWIFTPTAHYLEEEPHSDETPNAIALSPAQVETFALRFCPATRDEAIHTAKDRAGANEVASLPHELGIHEVDDSHFDAVQEAIKLVPPAVFDVVRQVRVFEAYLQYVEMKLTGAAIQKHKIRIPPVIQRLGSSKDLEGRLRTTFDLIEKRSALSSKALEDDLTDIRKHLTPSLGKNHGRVVLKSAKPLLIQRIDELRAKLEAHQKTIRETLEDQLKESRKQVVEYYLPLARNNPPDEVIGQSLSGAVTDTHLRKWLDQRLSSSFPNASAMIEKMTLEVRYKDMTFETLNQDDFLDSVKSAFPYIDWDKTYNDFLAAGEKRARNG